MSNRSAFLWLLLIAPLSWGALLLFTYLVPPVSTLAFVTVFLVLTVALTSTLSPVAFVVGSRIFSRWHYHVTMRHAIRQGGLLALVIVLNLVLRSLQSWTVFTAVVLLGTAVILEVLSLARK